MCMSRKELPQDYLIRQGMNDKSEVITVIINSKL